MLFVSVFRFSLVVLEVLLLSFAWPFSLVIPITRLVCPYPPQLRRQRREARLLVVVE